MGSVPYCICVTDSYLVKITVFLNVIKILLWLASVTNRQIDRSIESLSSPVTFNYMLQFQFKELHLSSFLAAFGILLLLMTLEVQHVVILYNPLHCRRCQISITL
jgi:hypothetical protein